MRMMCLELLGWAWNCIAQRTHCQLIFMWDSICPCTCVSRMLLEPGICPPNYVPYVVQRVIRMLCLELLGWPSNCSAQRTHCELIFVFDNTWAGTFVSHILLEPVIWPHNYVQQVVQRVIRMRRLELFGWSSNCITQRTHCIAKWPAYWIAYWIVYWIA